MLWFILKQPSLPVLFLFLSVLVKFLFLNLLQVLFLRNFGVIVGGETIEETFHIANNLMIAVETQVGIIILIIIGSMGHLQTN